MDYDGRFEIPTFAEVLDLRARLSAELKRPVGIAPETKHPAYFASIGLPIEPWARADALSLGAALLINEFLPPRVSGPLASAIQLLAAIPSVVYGFWGILVVMPLLRPLQNFVASTPAGALPIFGGPQPGPSYFVAAVVLAIMILPIVTSIARESLAATPRLQREAALALGATDWETIRHVVLPFARGGIFAGIILGLSRAIGETIAVLFVIGNQPQINLSIFAPGYTLPSVVAGEFAEANQPFHSEALIALGIVLFVMSFGVNVLARLVVGRFERRAGGADVR